MEKIIYIHEPLLNSELIIRNNSKKLLLDESLLNEEHLPRIEELRQEFVRLEGLTDSGETGLQKEKRTIRDEIRDLSTITFTLRDKNIFGDMIMLIVKRIGSRPQFSNYTYLDQMKSLAIEHILRYSHGFDPYRQSKISGQYASAFAYISTIAFNAFVATINTFNKEQSKAKEEFLERQKLIHRDPNVSTFGPDYSTTERTVNLPTLVPDELWKYLKNLTIKEETKIIIPKDYKITPREMDFVYKYEYNISLVRPKEPKIEPLEIEDQDA